MPNLTPCPTCDHQVSTAARKCPSCGEPLQKLMQPAPVLEGIVFGAIILLVIGLAW